LIVRNGEICRAVEQILLGRSDANIEFDDLRQLLQRLGFEERVRGSHRLYRKAGIVEKLNLHQDGAKAKPYQQVRHVILRYGLQEVLDV